MAGPGGRGSLRSAPLCPPMHAWQPPAHHPSLTSTSRSAVPIRWRISISISTMVVSTLTLFPLAHAPPCATGAVRLPSPTSQPPVWRVGPRPADRHASMFTRPYGSCFLAASRHSAWLYRPSHHTLHMHTRHRAGPLQIARRSHVWGQDLLVHSASLSIHTPRLAPSTSLDYLILDYSGTA